MRLSHVLGALLCLLLVLAACGPTPVAAPAAEEADPDAELASEEVAEDAAMESDGEEAAAEEMAAGETAAEEAAAEEAAVEAAADGEMAAEEVTAEEMADGDAADGETTGTEMAESEPEAEPAVERPVWQQIALTDVQTGETFTLGDFAGKTVFVEPMATWCTNCRAQLGVVKSVREQLSSDDVVFIGISVETNLSAEQLAQYQTSTGYDWPFAVATPELVQALVDQFGQSITNPPSTPHFIIRADGSATELDTGMESSEELIAQITEAQG